MALSRTTSSRPSLQPGTAELHRVTPDLRTLTTSLLVLVSEMLSLNTSSAAGRDGREGRAGTEVKIGHVSFHSIQVKSASRKGAGMVSGEAQQSCLQSAGPLKLLGVGFLGSSVLFFFLVGQ